MVVTCEKCHTRFLLDEARITGARVQARCSRCQHVFWVEREEVVREEAHPEDEETGLHSAVMGEPSSEAAEEAFRLEAALESETVAAAEKAEMPKPSTLFTSPTSRSSRTWIIAAVSVLAGVLLVGGVFMWFGGYGWVTKYLKFKGKPPAPAAKVAEPPPVVETVPPPPVPQAAAEDLQNLALSNTEERYRGLVNTKGGQLLVIQGKVKNSSSQPRGPIKIKAVLTDPQQKTVKEREFYAGSVVFDDELQNLEPEEINRWLDTPGGRAQKQMIEPGESQSFMVVFFGAPQNLSGYGYKMQVVQGPVASSPSRRK